MAGRPPKPEGLRLAQGDPGKRGSAAKRAARKAAKPPAPPPAVEPEAAPVADPAADTDPATLPETASTAPSHLSDEARAIWDRQAPHLVRMKFLRTTDVEAFARYCEMLVRWWKLNRDIAEQGEYYTIKSKHGTRQAIHPAVRVCAILDVRLEALEDRLGMNPRARQQIMLQMANAPGMLPGFDDPARKPGHPPADTAPAPKPSPVGMLNSSSVH